MANIELKDKLELSASDIQIIKDYEIAKAKYEMCISRNDNAIKEYMKNRVANGLEPSITQDGLTITYKAPHTRKSVDNEKLKRDGLYENYLKETQVKDSISVKVVYDEI